MAANASIERRGLLGNPFRRLEPSWRKALRSPPVIGLITVLVIQVGAALVLAGQGLQRSVPDESLLEFSPQQVRDIEITSDGRTLNLSREAAGWVLPDLDGFPADADKVEQLLVQLSALPRSIPVAASAESRQRLKVADDNVDTRVTLLGERKEIAELLTGDSPGFRRLYGRVPGEEEVYDLPLAEFQLTSDRDDWVQRDHLRLDADAIERISTDGWTLKREGDEGWQLEGDARPVDHGAADAFVRRLANLTYQGVEVASADEASTAEPVLRVTIELEDGSVHQRRIMRTGEDGYLVGTGAGPHRYALSDYDLDGVLEIDPEALAAKEEPGPGATARTTPKGEMQDTAEAETSAMRAPDDAAAISAQGPAGGLAGGLAGGPAGDPAESDASASAASAPAVERDEPATAPAPESASESPAELASGPTDGEAAATATVGDEIVDEQRDTQETTRPSEPARQPPWPYQQRYAPPPQPHWPPQGPPQRQPPPPGWR